MKITAKQAADLVGGQLFGDSAAFFENVARIQEAKPGDLTFLYLPAYEKHFSTTKASIIITKPDFEKSRDDITYIVCESPNFALQKILIHYFTYKINLTGIDASASISESVVLGDNISIGKNVIIGENVHIGNNSVIMHNSVILDSVNIGEDVLIYPNVTIREDSKIGNNVIIHSGSVIGSDGFGYTRDKNSVYTKVPQIGNVVIKDDVEIGSNCSIDRAAIGSTVIAKGCKLDNLVQIAHNVSVGENTVISSQSGIAGSTEVGERVILAGQVGIAGHLKITNDTVIMAQSGVSKSITKPGNYFGYPAKEMTQTLRLEAHIRSLPSYLDRIKKLEAKIAEFEKGNDEKK
ncbi:MAG: UDP-3-O-(3-hydroxymyristoyl)glucosamine N-acyltransferase [Melioribacteraceae bacterium]|nr:UDP-3-O-(3-hydroxymyristoyl)glucosamine N-acyltransferase [Melioribacteraceae bacterium]MCF8264054.1 UDP-3-O-(3-hydroxymyristoyl)glucosamine N-acyltransferase [Melioribacteraceae bacterium]MCF8411866.1 UDP-3-O-(3-hydroxymyristoyl)glucosamine N-acyltransferase [Melioribacteraceae bacterium]